MGVKCNLDSKNNEDNCKNQSREKKKTSVDGTTLEDDFQSMKSILSLRSISSYRTIPLIDEDQGKFQEGNAEGEAETNAEKMEKDSRRVSFHDQQNNSSRVARNVDEKMLSMNSNNMSSMRPIQPQFTCLFC